DPASSVLYSPLTATSDDVKVAKLLDPRNLLGNSRFCWRNLSPIGPRLVQYSVEIVFRDRKSFPPRPTVKILHAQMCAELLVGSITRDEHRLGQDPGQVHCSPPV